MSCNINTQVSGTFVNVAQMLSGRESLQRKRGEIGMIIQWTKTSSRLGHCHGAQVSDVSRRPGLAVTGVGILMALALMAGGFVEAATFTVVNTADSGAGSLRQAILDANASAGADVVDFAIPSGLCSAAGVCMITIESTISIDEAVTIDGTTQPRYGTAPGNTCATATEASFLRVEILGPGGTRMLDVNSANPTTIRGLSLGGGYGISLHNGTGHKVQCNHLGLSGDGATGLGGYGVVIEGNASEVIIGTDGDGIDDLAERNVFADSAFGIYNNGNRRNWIAGNFFGFAADGVTALENSISIFMRQGSTMNLVGTNEDGVSDLLERNIIGNGSTGVYFSPGVWTDRQNRVVGNWIGLDADGNPAGVSTAIKIDTLGKDHVIRGNRIENNIAGIVAEDDVTLSPFSMCNSITGNSTGVDHSGTSTLTLQSNWWGDPTGPSGAGPGSGDSIVVTGSGAVDFTAWLDAADAVCPYVFADGFESGNTQVWDDISP